MILINTLKSISRAKGRNILIGIIILTIAVAASIALAIRSAAISAKEDGLLKQNISASIEFDRSSLFNPDEGGAVDRDSIREQIGNMRSLSLDELKPLAESAYVKNFYYQGTVSLNASDDLEAFALTQDTGRPQGGMGNIGSLFNSGDFNLTGFSSKDAMTDFISGSKAIIEGGLFSFDNVDNAVLINTELAQLNGFAVGDTITLLNPVDENQSYTLTIIGIYETQATSSNSFLPGANDPANQLYTSYINLEALAETSQAHAITSTNDFGSEISSALSLNPSATFVFADLDDYNAFAAILEGEDLLPENFILYSADITAYQQSIEPLQQLSSFATSMLVIVLLVGAIILIVINLFNIRERKFEVGVYTAIGIPKIKVASQFILELLLVAIFAILLGTGIGALASVPVSNQLLASQIDSSSSSNNFENMFPQGGNTQGNMPERPAGNFPGIINDTSAYINEVNASVDLRILGQLIVIGLVLTIISSSVAIIYVMRYEPLQILAERS